MVLAMPQKGPKKWSKNCLGHIPEGSPKDSEKMIEKWSPCKPETIGGRPKAAPLFCVSKMVENDEK